MDISTLIALAGLVLASVTFLIGRKTASRDEGKESGIILTELGYIKAGVDDVKCKQDVSDERYIVLVSRMAAVESSIKQALQRLDKMEGISYE